MHTAMRAINLSLEPKARQGTEDAFGFDQEVETALVGE